MICVQLLGGLGNQMFQYACGRALAYKHQTELLLDTSRLQNRKDGSGFTERSFELGIFDIHAREANTTDIKSLKPFLYRLANVISIRTGFHGIQASKYFIENEYSYNGSIEKTGKDCFLSGYWQSNRYFKNIESIIREEFKFNQVLNLENENRLAQIKHKNSVSMHIRRSDFLNNKYHDSHGTCSIEYYNKAVEYIAKRISSPFFFIFSDDIKWALENLNLSYPCEFIFGNTGKQSFIDMQLMSLCKHNIIANSSFSWWGAWLNQNVEKIVVSPKQWLVDEKKNAQTIDLIPEKWLKL